MAGLAAGLIAGNPDLSDSGTYRAKRLVVRSGARTETALVDVAISDADAVGSGAVWDASTISQLFLTIAEADAIGLSSIGGHLRPLDRRAPGVHRPAGRGHHRRRLTPDPSGTNSPISFR